MDYDAATLERIGKRIRTDVVAPHWDFRRRVFLCGAATGKRTSVRERLAAALTAHSRHSTLVYYPEKLFDELLTGVGRHDLLSLENLLAEGVTAIVVVLESPGAMTELGAFANHDQLRKKLIVVQDKKFVRDRSFIQLGPIRLLRDQRDGRVIDADFNNPEASAAAIDKAVGRLSSWVAKFDMTNLFHAQEFVLPALYLFQALSREELLTMVIATTGLHRVRCEAIVAGSLAILLADRFVALTSAGYTLTVKGAQSVRRADVVRNHVLDELRVDILHRVCRRKKEPFPYV
ncbi:MAG TPA: retron St85 family effector protein [Polyangiales bacterium]